MTNTQNEITVEKQANSFVLYLALGINIVVLIYSIYLAGSVAIAIQPDLSIISAMWEFTTNGGMMVH